MSTAQQRSQTQHETTEGPALLDQVIDITEKADIGVLSELTRAEIDMKISTARRYPRSLTNFKRKLLEMATLDEETAGTMFYSLPRDGKTVSGPSVRMAEAVTSAYGNIMSGARVVAVEKEFVVAQGFCHDLENNVSNTHEIRRRITRKDGSRFGADMIQTTGNAAAAIAFRESVFKVVPRSLFKREYEAARLTSLGKVTSIVESRRKAFEWYQKAGATEQQLLDYLGRKGMDDVDVEDLINLRGLVTAIRDGEITIEDALRPPSADDDKRVKTRDLSNRLAKAKEAPVQQASPAKPAENLDAEPAKQEADAGSAESGVSEIPQGAWDALADCEKIAEVTNVQERAMESYGFAKNAELCAEWHKRCSERKDEIRGKRGKAEQKSLMDTAPNQD